MIKVKEIPVFTIEDHPNKDAALDTLRALESEDSFWHEHLTDPVYGEFIEQGRKIGIEIDRIYFTGFWSQGDGACFEGQYSYKPGSAVEDDLPEPVRDIAKRLQTIQRKAFYSLSADVTHSGHYCHEYCTHISVDCEYGAFDEDGLIECLRDFMRYMYSALEDAYEYGTSDETLEENAKANQYWFYEDGSLA